MSDQPRQTNRFLGFVTWTLLLTPVGLKPTEELRPGDFIQTQPDDDKGDDKPEGHDDDHAGNARRWWEEN